jgi:chromosomal replication initiation ATPase DnaA
VDQRFLGDERFIEEADRRTATTREVSVHPQRLPFGTLLTAIARVYAVTPRAILAPGRHRALVPARAMLVGLARQWSQLTVRELGRRLQRDPSMISRLAATYATHTDARIEAHVRRAVQPRHSQ